MIWIAIRMLTGDRQKFYGLVFGIAFSTLLITQQLTIFINLLERGATFESVVAEPAEIAGSYERLTGAALDRLTHRCSILEFTGESYRLQDARRRRRTKNKE